ncbi:MAG: BlaI/MecI/CopY family transcriptional regulator [Alistipes sp.]|nr:BlaI/MecI/CopY family transcriptional regulator [Rikenellaceae bacterium]MBP3474375.1 BlaI/MecI/CopY family transcriptional regulator [Alistipes sp.]MBQ4540579.1 BlaI/MecI/CopY family transcriptional regulator [Alistipes sp.]MDO5488326.1 BlaI/MecI/CopY family transcriptional regulator [Rikenellaceae bacterium]
MAERLKPKTQELTRAELEIMQILWDRGSGFVNDILEALPEPKPAYNTVSTVVRILEKKGYVEHKAYGKSHEYYPIVDRDSYTQGFMSSVLNNFFGGSASRMVSFLSSNKSISMEEADEIMKLLKK